MLRVEFEPMIPVSERAKKVHALDRAASGHFTLTHCTIGLGSLIMSTWNQAAAYYSGLKEPQITYTFVRMTQTTATSETN
jgi:hypothetical protein